MNGKQLSEFAYDEAPDYNSQDVQAALADCGISDSDITAVLLDNSGNYWFSESSKPWSLHARYFPMEYFK